MGVVQALHFMNEIRYRSYDHHEPVYSSRFFGPNFPPLWNIFRPGRWQFRVGCCLWGRLKLQACWHRPVSDLIWPHKKKSNGVRSHERGVYSTGPFLEITRSTNLPFIKSIVTRAVWLVAPSCCPRKNTA